MYLYAKITWRNKFYKITDFLYFQHFIFLQFQCISSNRKEMANSKD